MVATYLKTNYKVNSKINTDRELRQHRCVQCQKLLGIGQAKLMEIKCPRCGALNYLTFSNNTLEPPKKATGVLTTVKEATHG